MEQAVTADPAYFASSWPPIVSRLRALRNGMSQPLPQDEFTSSVTVADQYLAIVFKGGGMSAPCEAVKASRVGLRPLGRHTHRRTPRT